MIVSACITGSISSTRRVVSRTDSTLYLLCRSRRTTISLSAMNRSPSRARSRSFKCVYAAMRGSSMDSMEMIRPLGIAQRYNPAMPVDEAVLPQARKFDRQAVEAILEGMYPLVHRTACALSGREDVGRGIVRFVMNHAIRQLPRWSNSDTAERWFLHFVVLTSRRAKPHPPAPEQD